MDNKLAHRLYIATVLFCLCLISVESETENVCFFCPTTTFSIHFHFDHYYSMVRKNSRSTTTTMGTMMTTNWEDMMNQMIREFNQQQQQMMVNVPTNNVNNNNHRPDNIDINVEECISNILAIIDTIQNQTTTTTTTTIVSII